MNLTRIRAAAEEIERYEKALDWLQNHGRKISKESDEIIDYRPNFAGSCNGSNAAASVLCAMMKNQLPELISRAIKNCQNTIEIYRQAIRDEVNK